MALLQPCIAMLERRAKLRVTSTLEGQASIAGSRVRSPCVVLNHSPTGACVLFASGTKVPNTFDLSIGKGSTTLPVRVVWRRNATMGVAFLVPRIVPDVIPG
ncbi:PilZ domain-containing protein [Methylobacterium sp. E-005]|uniref:PilZ domain-containing protein n=1 Tax=Methylobacterium sp. E-005 TaxID=2836549 RepID=UPI00391C15E9